MNIKVKTSFRLLMLAYIILSSLTMILSGAGCIFGFADNMMRRETANIGKSFAFSIDNFFSYYADSINIAANNVNFLMAASGELSAVQEQLKHEYATFMNNDDYILDIVIMDKNGGVVYDGASSLQGTVFFGFSDELLNSGKNSVLFSHIFADNEKYADSVFLVQKHILRGEETAGFVSAVISVSAISDLISGMQFFGNGHIAVFDNMSCAVNYFNDSEVVRYDEINNTALINTMSEAVQSSTPGTPDTHNTDYNVLPVIKDKGIYSSYHPIGNTGWCWAALTTASEFITETNNIYGFSVIFILSTAVLMIILSILYTKNCFAPVKAIIKNAEELKSGNRNSRITLKKIKGEFREICEILNDLSDQSALNHGLNKAVSALSDNMLFEWDYKKNKMYLSQNFADKFEINIDEATLENGKFIEKLMDEKTAARYKNQLASMISSKNTLRGEYRVRTRAGNEIWVKAKAMVISGRLDEPLRVVGVLTDIDNEKRYSLKLSKRASYDFLSELYNRNAFGHELESELSSLADGEKIALIFIDVDDFKHINDKYSHATGDEVIKFVADVLRRTITDKGFAGRFGGDEFVLCVTGMSESSADPTVKKIAETITENLYEGFTIINNNTKKQERLHITASMGIAFAPDHGTEVKQLTANADKAMYQVKKHGKSGFLVYRAGE